MDEVVQHMRGHLRWPRGLRLSLAGDSFIERARSTTFALLGSMAAVGLAIVALALQQDWPLLGNNPIPGPARESGTMRISGAVALTRPAAGPAIAAAGVARSASSAGRAAARPNHRPNGDRAQLVASPLPVAAPPAPAAPGPAPPPPVTSTPAPATPAPESSTPAPPQDVGGAPSRGETGSRGSGPVSFVGGSDSSSSSGNDDTGSSGPGAERGASGRTPAATKSSSPESRGPGASASAPGHGGTVPGNAYGREAHAPSAPEVPAAEALPPPAHGKGNGAARGHAAH